MTIAKQKNELRQQLLDKRLQLSEEEYLSKSEKIITKLKSLSEFKNSQTIHCYVSLNERNEVNTLPLIKELAQEKRKLVVPVTNFNDGSLRHVHLKDFDLLKENKWGVLEPQSGEEVAPEDLDLVIVPMAGGDRRKNRIGYGKGFYDRFLSKVDCPKVGLLFDDCLVEQVPVEDFDIPLSTMITEEQIIQ